MDGWAVVQSKVAEFASERDWDQFHTPKNLAMALAGEVGELNEIFQWLTAEESAAVMSSPRAQDVRDELADVLIYLVRLADVLDVDLIGAGFEKLRKNALRNDSTGRVAGPHQSGLPARPLQPRDNR